jgi:DNA modification methylase
MSDSRLQPGQVRDAIVAFLRRHDISASVSEICEGVRTVLGKAVPNSSVRSYLNLNTPSTFTRTSLGRYQLASRPNSIPRISPLESAEPKEIFRIGRAVFFLNDCLDWLRHRAERSIHAIVTDPPYGLVEYSREQQAKMRSGKGGVWRIPPSFDGCQRAPLPRFTTLSSADIAGMVEFFKSWGRLVRRVLVPGANVIVASNPLVSYAVSQALVDAGLERRGEIIRMVMTLRGGDRPKNAHLEFPDVSVMPRSMWEPWLLFREPLEGRVQDNLRKWKTGALRRISPQQPFGDVIESSPTRKREREIAPHPSLKPQAFLRKIVRAALPLEEGVILDPFAGAGSTLAACEHAGYASIGVEIDEAYAEIAREAIPQLVALESASSR